MLRATSIELNAQQVRSVEHWPSPVERQSKAGGYAKPGRNPCMIALAVCESIARVAIAL